MDNNRVDVYVNEGRLIGIFEESIHGDRYAAFRGIPYARPPIGQLRFKDSSPPDAWSGGRDASRHGNCAVQFDMLTRKLIGDEDCLYLNVYTTNIDPKKKRAVMVWIHGGGFTMGTGDSTIYGPDHIIRKDVVLVTLNYRLGVLGFLNLNDEVAAGNQGLKDVVMALRWVQKNISRFGGDSGNVTIFGESAGGAIVHHLTLTPLAEGLFHKAISQSGVATNPWAYTDMKNQMINRGFQFAEKLGKVTSNPKDACKFLQTIDAKKLIETEKSLATEEERMRQQFMSFGPSPDDEAQNPFFPEKLNILLRRGIKVPFLVGFNTCEGSFLVSDFFSPHMNKENLKKIDCDFKKAILPQVLSSLPQIPITIEELRFLYFGNKAISEETIINYSDFLGDVFFYRGIMEAIDAQVNSNNNKPVYLYKFSYESENNIMKKIMNIKIPGVSHSEDLFYLFFSHMMKDMDLSLPTPDTEEYKMINRFTQMWTDFAKTGDPTPVITDLTPVKWTPMKRGVVQDYLNINDKPQMEIFRKGEQRWDWKNIKHNL